VLHLPTLTRWFIKSAMLYLIAALILSIGLQPPLRKELPFLAAAWPTYLHLLVLGWLTQLIFGVALWLFPKHSRAHPRGDERLGWASFLLLNVGLVLRAIAEPSHALGYRVGALLIVAAAAQLLAGLAFVLNTWPRVRER
jgi:heme/copper-type cytochrome/quinol oxidase subunit 1